MNQSYKTVFSKVHQCFVVVSELAKSQGKGSRASRLKKTAVALLAATAFGGLSGQAWAEPTISDLSETVNLHSAAINELAGLTAGFPDDKTIKKYIDEYKEAAGETSKLQSDAINELAGLTAGFPEGETIKKYIDETDTNTTYKVEKTVGTGKTVNTYTLKASDNSETGETIVDTDTYVKESSVSSSTDSATGTTTHTVTLKDNTGTEMTSFAVTDTNTQSTVKHADSSKDYLTVTSADNNIGTKDYTVGLTDTASTAIKNANTFLNSSGNVTVTNSGFKAGNVTVTSEGFKVGESGPSMTADGIDAGSKVISNVKAGEKDTDAVNVGQLNATNQKIDSQDNALRKLAHRDAQLERKIYRAGAHAAAIAALHPLDYDEDHKFTAAAGVGQYHGSSAMAVGAFYRPTENLMFSVGASLNENDSMVNAGMAYRFGTGSGNKTSPDNIHEMKRQISTLSEENRQLSAQLSSSEAKLASSDAKILTLEEKIRRIEKMLKLK